jgi:hypothetical protein
VFLCSCTTQCICNSKADFVPFSNSERRRVCRGKGANHHARAGRIRRRDWSNDSWGFTVRGVATVSCLFIVLLTPFHVRRVSYHTGFSRRRKPALTQSRPESHVAVTHDAIYRAILYLLSGQGSGHGYIWQRERMIRQTSIPGTNNMAVQVDRMMTMRNFGMRRCG